MGIDLSLIPVTGCICLALSIIEGWALAFMRYLKIKSLNRVFPGYRYLVRSHIDYVIMAVLLFTIYLVLSVSGISISKPAILALTIGALYNPAGFILQAINPKIAEGDSVFIRFGTLAGFIPITYGLFAVCSAIIYKLL